MSNEHPSRYDLAKSMKLRRYTVLILAIISNWVSVAPSFAHNTSNSEQSIGNPQALEQTPYIPDENARKRYTYHSEIEALGAMTNADGLEYGTAIPESGVPYAGCFRVQGTRDRVTYDIKCLLTARVLMHTHPNKRLVYNIPSPRDISLFYYYPELKVQVIITHNGMYILTRPENDQGEFDVQARRFVCEFKIMEEVLVTYVDTQITDKGRASFAFNNIIREYSRSNRFVRYAPHQRLLQDIFDKNLQILGDAANMPPELKSISDRILQLTRRDAKRKCS